MTRFSVLALAALMMWGSALAVPPASVVLSAQDAPAGDQQTRGKSLYVDKCASCHMENLEGSTETPPLTGDMFWMNWDTYNANNFVEQVRATMPEDNPGGLERQEYVDIVAYILKTNSVAFDGDLPSDMDALKKIVIKKP
jgi:mono/diheme cytochrome c family protein